MYLATIMDLFTRRIIGWEMSRRMTKELIITALKRAINQQPPQKGLIHHSDRGRQYAAYDYQAILRDHKITTSMSRKGNCYDNACIESFHSVIKKELIFHQKYQNKRRSKKKHIYLYHDLLQLQTYSFIYWLFITDSLREKVCATSECN
ncbi:hypothetical protein D1839_19515 [Roseburia sp. 1XD42-34]|nr:hypothetical protein [Roseburia sp. 1XD42-34]RKI74100.1 hypothetical protein D7V87_19500 [Clostridium sp. 1xD42-85]